MSSQTFEKFKYNQQGYRQARRFLMKIPDIQNEYETNKTIFEQSSLVIKKANQFYNEIYGKKNDVPDQGEDVSGEI